MCSAKILRFFPLELKGIPELYGFINGNMQNAKHHDF